jgi:hypothetical protein
MPVRIIAISVPSIALDDRIEFTKIKRLSVMDRLTRHEWEATVETLAPDLACCRSAK